MIFIFTISTDKGLWLNPTIYFKTSSTVLQLSLFCYLFNQLMTSPLSITGGNNKRVVWSVTKRLMELKSYAFGTTKIKKMSMFGDAFKTNYWDTSSWSKTTVDILLIFLVSQLLLRLVSVITGLRLGDKFVKAVLKSLKGNGWSASVS